MKLETIKKGISDLFFTAHEGEYVKSGEEALHRLYEDLDILGVPFYLSRKGYIVALVSGHPRKMGKVETAQYGHQYLSDLKFSKHTHTLKYYF